ncbi:MAG: hypothetical protein HN472_07170 [Nitrospina sp.]|jgi:hypothetical protein|nr:hypothetical protein [Nitrospina sp.]
MAKKNRRQRIEGQFVPLQYILLDSLAYQSLGNSSKVGLIYFYKDKKNVHQETAILTFPQAKKYGVCQSSTTFDSIKKELVEKGFLNPFVPGGLGKHSIFKISSRWKLYGTDRFNEIPFEAGCGSKQFQIIWKDEKKRNNLLHVRHGKKKQDAVST